MTSPRNVEDQAWVTLATNDTYGLGALTLGKSLHRVGTTRKLVILITSGVTSLMRERLSDVFDLVQEVNVFDSSDAANLQLLARPDLGITFTKLHCWRLTQYKKAVFLDADVLVLQNVDELFSRDELSAAPDVGWPDCFNSGVFVFQPSNETYNALVQTALTTGSFDGADQGLLNIYFNNWATADIAKHLPFIYNMTSSSAYTYLPAYQKFGKDVKIVHFIGPVKPWMHRLNSATGQVEHVPGAYHAHEHLQTWWDIFSSDVRPHLQPELAGLAGQLALLSLGQDLTPEQKLLDDRARQFAWEQGQVDYKGADAFSNIQKKLDQALSDAPQPQTSAPEAPAPPSEAPAPPSEAPAPLSEAPAPPTEVAPAPPSQELVTLADTAVPVIETAASVASLAEDLVAAALTPLIGASADSHAVTPEVAGSGAVIPLPVTPDAHFTSEISFPTNEQRAPEAVAPVVQTPSEITVAPLSAEAPQPTSQPSQAAEAETQKTETVPTQASSVVPAESTPTQTQSDVSTPITQATTQEAPPVSQPAPVAAEKPSSPVPAAEAPVIAPPPPPPPAEIKSQPPPAAPPAEKPKSPPPSKPKSPPPAKPQSPTSAKPKSPPVTEPKSPILPAPPKAVEPSPPKASKGKVSSPTSSQPATPTTPTATGPVPPPPPPAAAAAAAATQPPSQPPKKTKGSKKPKSP